MIKNTLTLTDLKQVKEQKDYDDFITVSHYLQQSPSNTVQYL